MKPFPSCTELSDRDLLAQARRLADHERQATAALIACLAEIDARRLYLGEGCSSLFTWCTDVLHLSRDAAYGRIEAARVARRFPIVLDLLASGSVTMTVVALLGPHLTAANHRQLLAGAHHKSKREIEHVVASLAPKPDVPTAIRKLPAPAVLNAPSLASEPLLPNAVDTVASRPDPGGSQRSTPAPASAILASGPETTAMAPAVRYASAHRPVIAPLAPERYKIQFTVGAATHDKLRRAQDLLRHAVPNGDPAEIFDRALTLLVAQLEKQKWAAAARRRATPGSPPKGRTIPASVRRAVSRRDDGRCAFVGTHGRCAETGLLEFHHVVPFARGGAATEENIQLRCRAHNQHEARRDFPNMIRESPVYYGVSRWRAHGSPNVCGAGRLTMKLSLSRKGFDSTPLYGACASPILQDGRMVSLPIPHASGTITFGELRHRGLDMGQVVSDLTGKPELVSTGAHLDPDLDSTARERRRGWRPAFGQDSAAQRHLERQGVGVGDLFLFFGWFREVTTVDGRYRYRPGAPDRHVLFGWLRVGQVLRVGPDRPPQWMSDHPHALRDCAPHNTIYVADGSDGGGVFQKFAPCLQLTDPTSTGRSLWRLPADFLPGSRLPLTYHSASSRWTDGGDHCRLQSVAKGQEFVLDLAEYPGVQRWAEELVRREAAQ